ncbi:MAG: hypothetical protein HZB29_05015 [Nitrospinae bacterium]|nr:hypothetical protein [Nitrospinota bacterium]
MRLIEELQEAGAFAARQSKGFVEILKLKIRIIGFSNKRGNILTKLGEVSYKAISEGRQPHEDDNAKRLVEDIREAEREIATGDETISQKKEELLAGRRLFRSRLWGADASAENVRPVENAGDAPENPGENKDTSGGQGA